MKTKVMGRLLLAAFSTALAVTAIAAPASDPVDQGMAVSIAIFKVKPGQETDFEKIMRQVAIDSRNDPGNLEYRLQQSVADPHIYVAYEVFRTAEDAEAHASSEHIQKVLPAVLKMLEGGVDAQSYQFLK